MGAVDPTYPLLPAATLLSAVMVALVLLTSVVRQNWNLGVIFLCSWLFIETLVNSVNFILWSDNGYIKLFVYCDIGVLHLPVPALSYQVLTCHPTVSHLQIFTFIVKPACTLIITRQLYKITSMHAVHSTDSQQVRLTRLTRD